MKGIVWYLRGEYGSFRPYDTTSIIDTYLFPPKTTIIGMIGAACGWSEDDLVEYYDRIKAGIKIEHFHSVFNDLTKMWKVLASSEARKQNRWLYFPENRVYTFEELRRKIPSRVLRQIFVVVKRFLYRPEFTIYLTTLSEDRLVKDIENALKDPMYPITLGDSDSLFYPRDMQYIKSVEVKDIKSCRFHCLLDAEKVRKAGGIKYTGKTAGFTIYPRFKTMPVSFKKNRKEPKIKEIICFSGEIELNSEIEAYEFNGEPVYLF